MRRPLLILAVGLSAALSFAQSAPPELAVDVTWCADAGGHACLFRGGNREEDVFHPLAPAVAGLHRRLKQVFDPQGLFNPGRMYAGL